MPRIVGGRARGRQLAVPRGPTRPTAERAREALFNSLAGLLDLDGAHVLDLFAGSGAVGFEALSRGAATAVLVDSARTAVDVLHRNARALDLPGARVVRGTAAGFLTAPAGIPAEAPFHLVFADPPYAFGDAELAALLAALAGPGWLADGAIVVVERSARSPQPAWPEQLEPVKQRRYGDGALWYGRWR